MLDLYLVRENEEQIEEIISYIGQELIKEQIIKKEFGEENIESYNEKGHIYINGSKYTILDYKELRKYAYYFMEQKREQDSYKIFDCLAKTNPTFFDNLVELDKCIAEEEYGKAYPIIDLLLQKEFASFNYEALLLLFLLNPLTNLNDKYKKIIEKKDFSFEYSGAKKLGHIPGNHDFIKSVSSRRFGHALSLLNDQVAYKESMDVFEHMYKKLLIKNIEFQRRETNCLLDSAIDEDYESILYVLKQRTKVAELNHQEKAILKLTNNLIQIQEGTFEPVIKANTNTRSVFYAIENDNYALALKLSKKHSQEKKMKSILCLLLEKIQKYHPELFLDIPYDENREEQNYKDTLDCLNNHDLKGFKENMFRYFEEKGDYEFGKLILDISKIDILEKNDFKNTKEALQQIKDIEFDFSIDQYLSKLPIALADKKYLEAKIYCRIIFRCIKITGRNEEQIMNNIIELQNYCKEQDSKEETKLFYYFQKEKENIDEIESLQNIPIVTKEDKEKMKPYAKEIHVFLSENANDIFLTKPLTVVKRNLVRENITLKENASFITVGEKEPKKLAIYLKNIEKDPDKLKAKLEKADELYGTAEYTQALREYASYITSSREIRPYAFNKVTCCYAKLGDEEQTEKYFEITNALYRTRKNREIEKPKVKQKLK